jgi:hypothetical protein
MTHGVLLLAVVLVVGLASLLVAVRAFGCRDASLDIGGFILLALICRIVKKPLKRVLLACHMFS